MLLESNTFQTMFEYRLPHALAQKPSVRAGAAPAQIVGNRTPIIEMHELRALLQNTANQCLSTRTEEPMRAIDYFELTIS
jgi:hypothetical protein